MTNKRVSLIIFFDADNNIMLNQRRGKNGLTTDTWELIGGGIESGELPEEAIVREVSEELHYQLDEEKDQLVFIQKIDIDNDTFKAEVYLFKAVFPGLNYFSDSDETFVSDLQLFTLTDAKALKLLPISKHILQTVLR